MFSPQCAHRSASGETAKSNCLRSDSGPFRAQVPVPLPGGWVTAAREAAAAVKGRFRSLPARFKASSASYQSCDLSKSGTSQCQGSPATGGDAEYQLPAGMTLTGQDVQSTRTARHSAGAPRLPANRVSISCGANASSSVPPDHPPGLAASPPPARGGPATSLHASPQTTPS